ncbi:lipopolysaccharide biosynthesis protein [Ancylomarina sp. DW003]|nr:lipopolysaccharide biosynthesis protein [Ancylomarina sp. DW003]MDE5423396.1 lipopolysaccharide biosynthesis protein [Ancylomarina sp. DW003]
MGSLKDKTLNGFFWSFFDNFGKQSISFVIGIILARLLDPSVYGILGMIVIFMAISNVFISSGFGTALIRKTDLKDADCNTTFIFNLGVSLFFYCILFFTSPFIASFFEEPSLKLIIRVLGIGLLINAASIVQHSLMTKRIDFKTQSKISITRTVFSGTVGIVMAYRGFGIWSLVAQQLVGGFLGTTLLWYYNTWKPKWEFSVQSFKELFGFGSKLLASALIDTTFNNLYYLVIGKYFAAAQLGYYTRAQGYSNLFSSNLTGIIERVSYPVLSSIQDNPDALTRGYKKILKSSILISFVAMMGLAACSESLVIILIGEKWAPCIPYLQLLCFSQMLYPLHAINLNILKVKGRSDLFLRLEIIKKCISIPVIIIGIYFGIKAMLIAMIFNGCIAYILNSYYTGRLIEYSTFQQLKDITPSFLVGIATCLAMWSVELLMLSVMQQFLVQLIVGGLLLIFILEILKLNEYMEIKSIFHKYFRKVNFKGF